MTKGLWALALAAALLPGPLSGAIHVKTNGLDTASGADWDNALATISNAVVLAVGGETTVLVSNGVYNVSAEILVTNGITITGIGGRDATTVQSPVTNCRIFRIAHADAVLEGFTVARGGWIGVASPPAEAGGSNGAGIYLAAGTVRDCIISNNTPTNRYAYGGGIYMESGMVSGCVVQANAGNANFCRGPGIYLTNGIVADCVVRANSGPYGILGAGVCMEGDGLVSHCVIQGNTGSSTYSSGSGVWMSGGTLQRSLICGNIIPNGAAYGNGGGVYISGGRMENCLVVSNAGMGTWGGGGVSISGGTIAQCTIAANRSVMNYREGNTSLVEPTAAGVQWRGGGTITNTIIYGNTRAGSQAQINIACSAGYSGAGFSNAFYYCCSPDLVAGSNGNITADPQMAAWKNGDFRLLPYSPCVDTGTNLEAGLDFEGHTRPQDGRGTGMAIDDMGCYELAAATGYFNCYFQSQTNEAFDALEAEFTASVFGPNTNGLYYWWDFGNGTQEGAGLGTVTRSYVHGIYSVSLTVSNEDAAVTNWTIADCIRVAGTNAYVATNGAHLAPYDTWAKAATSILAAVQAAVVTTAGATRVVVSNGTYNVPSSAASIFIDRGITVSGLNGASNTIVRGTAGSDVYPDVDLDHPDAVVDGLTLGNANIGAMVHRGTIRHCIIRNNSGDVGRIGGGRGGGLRMFGGVAENCDVVSNSVGGTGAQGAGVWLAGDSMARNCLIAYNGTPATSTIRGGGAYLSDGSQRCVLRNCLVVSNMLTASATASTAAGGGVCLSGGRVENCTIASNTISRVNNTGGGLYCVTGTVVNTIIYYNTLTNTVSDNLTGSVALVSYSCAPDLEPGALGNLTNEPGFVEFSRLDCHLVKDSPCVNAGTNQEWMADAVDLDGQRRIFYGRVDLGAYEIVGPKGAIVATW